jgi:nucleoside-diphosphate-sugar epimerase
LTSKYSSILVTGGAGFIGSHLVDRLFKEGFNVSVLDNLSAGKIDNLASHKDKENFHFIKGDIRDLDLVKRTLRDIDTVFHEAAMVSVSRSVDDPAPTNEVNVTGTLNLLKACLDSNVKRFIFSSSTAIYGDTKTLPISEDSVPQPISPYAVSKLAAECYTRVFYEVYGFETVCLRYFNVYGPRQEYGPYSGVITAFINRLNHGEPPIIYGDGEQTRDFVEVKDVVEANMLALRKKNAVGQTFNIATELPTTVNQLAKLLQEIMDITELKPVYAEPRPGDIKYNYASISKAREILGYEPKVSLKAGLTGLVEWWMIHRK